MMVGPKEAARKNKRYTSALAQKITAAICKEDSRNFEVREVSFAFGFDIVFISEFGQDVLIIFIANRTVGKPRWISNDIMKLLAKEIRLIEILHDELPNTVSTLFLDLLKAPINLIETLRHRIGDVILLGMPLENGRECC